MRIRKRKLFGVRARDGDGDGTRAGGGCGGGDGGGDGDGDGDGVLYRWSHLEMNSLTTCTHFVSLSTSRGQSKVSSDQSWLVKPMGGFNIVLVGCSVRGR